MKEATNRSRLYNEFAVFYSAHRCEHAPENPRRIFNLTFDTIYVKNYRRRMSEEEFLGVLYATLGFPGSEPPGLFETFDMRKYAGEKSAENHFLWFFARKLHGNIKSGFRKSKVNPARFVPHPKLSIHKGAATSETPANQQVRPQDVPELMAELSPVEVAVMHLKCWRDLSDREVGKLLDLDNRAVCRVRSAVAKRIQQSFGVETYLGV